MHLQQHTSNNRYISQRKSQKQLSPHKIHMCKQQEQRKFSFPFHHNRTYGNKIALKVNASHKNRHKRAEARRN